MPLPAALPPRKASTSSAGDHGARHDQLGWQEFSRRGVVPMVRALFGGVARMTLDETFEQLADAINEHLDMSVIARFAGISM